ATATASQTVTAKSVAGGTSSTPFTVTPDTTAPAGQTATLLGGPYYTSTSIGLVTGDGTDGGAGLDTSSRQYQRSDATLANGVCTGWSAFGGSYANPDTTVLSGHCYKYRFSIADKVGNRSAGVDTAAAMVDTTPPTAPSLAFGTFTNASATRSTVYFRAGAAGGFSVAPTSIDPESGVASYSLPSLGAGWTNTPG